MLGGSLRPVKHLVGEFPPSHCIVFAGQRVELHATLPAEGRIDVTTSIVSMTDRSTGVVLETAAMARNHADGTPLFTSHSSYFLRGLGSKPMSSGERPALVEQMWGASVTASTRDDQALLYRLCGDRNPLHSDPTFAARAGFGRPILHGLCTWATVARTVIGRVLGSDVGAVAEIDGQFRNPVFPGESIEIDVAQVDECELVYRARVGERVVVDGGRIRTTRGGDSVTTEPMPVPEPTPLTAPYWDAARRGELHLQRCARCDEAIGYPRLNCPSCGGQGTRVVPGTGHGAHLELRGRRTDRASVRRRRAVRCRRYRVGRGPAVALRDSRSGGPTRHVSHGPAGTGGVRTTREPADPGLHGSGGARMTTGCHIIGAAETERLGRIPDQSVLELNVEAGLRALSDAGVGGIGGDIDGVAGGPTHPHQVAHALGVQPDGSTRPMSAGAHSWPTSATPRPR